MLSAKLYAVYYSFSELVGFCTISNSEVTDLRCCIFDEVADSITEDKQDGSQNQNNGNPNNDFNVGRTVLTVQNIVHFIHHGNPSPFSSI
jgi:hypothetical protein